MVGRISSVLLGVCGEVVGGGDDDPKVTALVLWCVVVGSSCVVFVADVTFSSVTAVVVVFSTGLVMVVSVK